MKNFLQVIWWNDRNIIPEDGRECLCLIRGITHTHLDIYQSEFIPDECIAWCYVNRPEVVHKLETEGTAS